SPDLILGWLPLPEERAGYLHCGPGWWLTEQALRASTEFPAQLREVLPRAEAEMGVPGQARILVTQQRHDDLAWLEHLCANAPGEWHFMVRLADPAEAARYDARFAHLGPARVSFRPASSAPLPALLRAATVHVTDYSATALEAAAYGVPTVALSALAATIF